MHRKMKVVMRLLFACRPQAIMPAAASGFLQIHVLTGFIPILQRFFARRFRKTSPQNTCAIWAVIPSPSYPCNKQNKFHVFANVCKTAKTRKKSLTALLHIAFSYVKVNRKGS